MGTSLVLKLDARELLFAALVNPLEEFKLAALLSIRGGLFHTLNPSSSDGVISACSLPLKAMKPAAEGWCSPSSGPSSPPSCVSRTW